MRIAVLGTGSMGTALAETLIKAGHQVLVYNRTTAKTAPLVALGAKAAATPAEAIKAADATLVVPVDGAAVRDMLLSDATRGSLAGRKLLNVTTTTRDDIVEIAREVAKHSGDLAEVTVTVYPDQVRSGQGQYIIGCSAADEALWTKILLSIGECVHRAGEVGDASTAETPLVAVFAFNIIATAYAAAIGKKLNVAPAILQHYLTKNPTMTVTGAGDLLPQMFARQYSESTASVDNMNYAANMTLDAVRTLGVPAKVLEDMIALFNSASERGFGAKDVSSVYEVLLDPQRSS